MGSEKTAVDKEKIKSVIKKIANDREALRLLKEQPSEFATKFQLSADESTALKSADLLITARMRGLGQVEPVTYTFTTGSTITPR